jgi:hypothetical protein
VLMRGGAIGASQERGLLGEQQPGAAAPQGRASRAPEAADQAAARRSSAARLSSMAPQPAS